MRSEAPPLLPILRSRHQADLLTIILLQPQLEHSAADLARRLGLSQSTLHPEIHRLIETELVTVREAGRTRLLRANLTNRLVAPLTLLLTLSFGPHVVLAEEFRQLDGADLVQIYGSWAARYQGTPGPPPNDIDVLVVGQPNRADVYEAAERAADRLQIPVHPTIASRRRWQDATDALVQQIRSSDTVTVYAGPSNGEDES